MLDVDAERSILILQSGNVTIEAETSPNSDTWATVYTFDKQRPIEHGARLSQCWDYSYWHDPNIVWYGYWDDATDVHLRVDASVHVRVIAEFPPA